jgi:GNAT superfamily N-acetyltransferase
MVEMNLFCSLSNDVDSTNRMLKFFEDIAQKEDWQPGDQLRAHVARSVYFGVWDGEVLVGGLQLVMPDEAGEVPTHQVWPELPTLDATAGVLYAAVLAVLPEYRGRDGGAAFWQLGSALWRYCVEKQVKTIWLEATPKMLRCYRLLGWPLVVIGELRTHWGEPCYPCSLSVREVAGSLAECALSSTTYWSIFTTALQPRTLDLHHQPLASHVAT